MEIWKKGPLPGQKYTTAANFRNELLLYVHSNPEASHCLSPGKLFSPYCLKGVLHHNTTSNNRQEKKFLGERQCKAFDILIYI